MLRQMTATVRRLASKYPRIFGISSDSRATIRVGVGMVVWAVLGVALEGLFPEDSVSSVEFLGIGFVGLFVGFVFLTLHGRKVSGAVLLDVKPHPMKGRLLVLVGLSVLFTSGSIVWFTGFWRALCGVASAVFFATLAFGRFQIRGEGLWLFWHLMRWKELTSYRWDGEGDSTLMLQARTEQAEGAFQIPIGRKAAVDELIGRRVISAEPAPQTVPPPPITGSADLGG